MTDTLMTTAKAVVESLLRHLGDPRFETVIHSGLHVDLCDLENHRRSPALHL